MEYIKAFGIRYVNELPTIRKKKDTPLQPIYEAFMNAWEAIREKFTDEHLNMGHITLKLYCISNALSTENGIYDFDKLCIIDNGVGLNDTSYERLINLRDDSKHFSNKGTGRIQYIHTFDETTLSDEEIEEIIHKALSGVKITEKNNQKFEDTYIEESKPIFGRFLLNRRKK